MSDTCKYCSLPPHTIGGRQASEPAMCLKHFELMLFINRLVTAGKPITVKELTKCREKSNLPWHFKPSEIPALIKPMELANEKAR